MLEIVDAVTDGQIERCFEVMAQLRTSWERALFCAQVKRQQESGYVLTCARENGEVVAVSGWRIRENLAMGKHLYIEDLVVAETLRSRGYGAAMVNHLVQRGHEEGCSTIMLDSGVQRFAAHRFYLRHLFDIRAYLFVRSIAG